MVQWRVQSATCNCSFIQGMVVIGKLVKVIFAPLTPGSLYSVVRAYVVRKLDLPQSATTRYLDNDF